MTKPKRDAEATRNRILRAAQTVFSSRGYAAAGVRDITALAGVNPALVSRYFTSKEGLFEAAVADLLDVMLITALPRARFGAALIAAFTDTVDDRINPLPMLVLAMSDTRAREIAETQLRARFTVPLAQWFGGAHAEERVARLAILATGFFVYRLLYPMPPLTGAVAPATRRWLESAFQNVIDSPD